MTIKLKDNFQSIILNSTGGSELTSTEIIQNLWSGYGQIVRYGLKGSQLKSVVVKHVRWPDVGNHPRGWNTNFSHQRKLKSYEVEVNWYRDFSSACDESCRIPACLELERHEDEVIMVMEDLDAAGFPARKSVVNLNEIKACLSWLANFHATFLGEKPHGLWEIGTYWHLDTRPDELNELDDVELLKAANLIDQKLNESPFQTFVHGDAKLANFCFSPDGLNVAAVDFQYVGGGCGMKDVAYFIGSCLNEDQCAKMENELLDFYFGALRSALNAKASDVNFEDLENNWREMFPVAWTDFHRFLKGWSPGHWKINGYSERIASKVISLLKNEN
jgi:hypothetical protein